jgi:glyoxylase-like metal-dependent hydrolase (beta-lactamase superfamily II)
MATVDVLVTGHVAESGAGSSVHPTGSLVRDGDLVVVVDVDSVYDGSLWLEHPGDGHALTDGVRVIETPGHAAECAALVVDTADGTVVLTHAWWFADMTPVEDPLAWDQAALERSRARILDIADVVVPGHGPPFRPAARPESAEGAP